MNPNETPAATAPKAAPTATAAETAERDPSGAVVNYVPLSGDKVKATTLSLVTTGELTPDMAEDVYWLFGWLKGNNLTESAGAKMVGIDASTLHRVLRGQYGASYAGVCAKIAKFRQLTEERAHKRDAGFIETSTWRKIDAVCRHALTDGMPAFVYGASQIGKTTCLLEFARRNNHGTTKYLRMPAACTFSYFVRSLAAACYITHNRYIRVDDMRDRVCATIDSRNLLIVDEFHQVFSTVGERVSMQILEFVREVYDRTRCGVVMAATKLGERQFEGGPNAGVFDQFRRRGMIKLVLPDTPPAADVAAICRAYRLDPPKDEAADAVRQMLRQSGTGMLVKYVQAASALASKRNEPLTWDTFLSVWGGLSALAR